ncbi:hypothetical protein AB0L13_33055 [Saccharopolyspora shandongensis]|uniref:hypothetical protein n=1 Tax=Saccharopolyspora shandongensis TaxID=418495 RepID=UPI00341AF92C
MTYGSEWSTGGQEGSPSSGTTTLGDTPPRPDGTWTPNTSNAEGGNPWDINKGAYPPFPGSPKVPGGSEHPGKDVQVINVEAIKIYANNIEALLPVVTTVLRELDDLEAKGFGPGSFGAGNNLKGKVLGSGSQQGGASLVPSIRTVYTEAQTIIKEVVARCRDIAKKYKTAHELSELDAQEFKQMVTGVKSKVDGLTLGTTG